LPLAALVAVTIQVPAAVGVRVDPETVQGPESTTNEIDPAPLPPEVVSERVEPKVAIVEETVNALV
jgi:hypothetical protein